MQNNLNPEQESHNKKSLFLVSSAIYTRFGVYKKYERINQTIETCKSIREKVPDSEIIILDGGEQDITPEEKKLISPHIDGFYSFADSANIKEVQKSKSQDIVKNMIEIIMYGSFFDMMLKEGWYNNYKRIFKVSGRYSLNEHFDYQKHLNAKNKVIIRGPFGSQFNEEITGGVKQQYMCRLFSFDIKLLDYFNMSYMEMFKHMNHRLTNGGYIDIEHLLFDHLDPNVVETVDVLGIEGYIAPNGMGVSD